jgi:anhydro-N-acetylmuramic acid kinase
MLVAGLMSGTSLDGIDVAIVDIAKAKDDGLAVRGVATHCVPYDPTVRAALLGVSNCETHTREIARLHFLLPRLYAEAFHATCERAGLKAGDVALIGCHGQTVYHEGQPADVLGHRVASTLQLGDGSVLAELTGVPVVSDFRPRDIAAGGQGAPLVPYFDWLLFRDAERGRALVNIGGIANVTLLAAGCAQAQVRAYDSGPGNMAIDALVAHYTEGAKRYDADGEIALSGAVDPELLSILMSDDYYRRRAPKSAGREQYGREFVQMLLQSGLEPADLVATVTHLTAATIADSICSQLREPEEEGFQVIVSGGGVHNPALMRLLRSELPEEMELATTAEFGVDPDFKEAIAFAVLAHETWHRRGSNLPSATGARRQVVLGKVSY